MEIMICPTSAKETNKLENEINSLLNKGEYVSKLADNAGSKFLETSLLNRKIRYDSNGEPHALELANNEILKEQVVLINEFISEEVVINKTNGLLLQGYEEFRTWSLPYIPTSIQCYRYHRILEEDEV